MTETSPSKTLPVAILANAKGTEKAHLAGCRHTGKATLVRTEERVVDDSLLYSSPKEVADCLHTAAWNLANQEG